MRSHLRLCIRILIVIILFNLVFPQRVHAYIDPGTGSLIIQFLIGTIVGGLFVVKMYWHRLNLYIKKVFSKTKRADKIGK